MGLSKKHLEQLVKKKKRHERRPRAIDLSPAGTNTMRRMARDHTDVLQNIEFALVSTFRDDPAFDDAAALATLHAALLGDTQAENPQVNSALQLLHAVHEQREDLSPKVWQDCMRVVIDSIRTHSQLYEGETSYLDFVGGYIV